MLKVVAIVLLTVVAVASCTLAPDHCLHMSDCGDGTTCIEGLCVGADVPPAALSAAGDASSLPEASVTPVTDAATPLTDASQPADAGHPADAAGDAMTDAPTGD